MLVLLAYWLVPTLQAVTTKGGIVFTVISPARGAAVVTPAIVTMNVELIEGPDAEIVRTTRDP